MYKLRKLLPSTSNKVADVEKSGRFRKKWAEIADHNAGRVRRVKHLVGIPIYKVNSNIYLKTVTVFLTVTFIRCY